MHIAETHPSLQRGTIDATILPWSAFQPFKLAEVTSFHLEAPLGAGPGMFFMAKKKYQALNPQVRRILDENNGEPRARSWARSSMCWPTKAGRTCSPLARTSRPSSA
jgi:TRAP-type C4-dicarboxylate transport system substrate-binding protein